MGTAAGYANEWLELYNTTDQAIDLTGWSIVAADGTPNIPLSGVISASDHLCTYSFVLLKRQWLSKNVFEIELSRPASFEFEAGQTIRFIH